MQWLIGNWVAIVFVLVVGGAKVACFAIAVRRALRKTPPGTKNMQNMLK